MIKKALTSAVLGISIMAFAGNAAAIDINVYGASAQFLFWEALASKFLQSKGCSSDDVCTDGTCDKERYDSKNGITRRTPGTSCPITYIRYASKASYDGVDAICGRDAGNQCTDESQRKMVDEDTCPGGANGAWNGTGSTQCSGTKCVPVTIGASDVPGECFTQQSHGDLLGCKQNGGWTDRVFPAEGYEMCGTRYQTNVVPFAFYVYGNQDPATAISGEVMIEDISQSQVQAAYMGVVAYWSDLGITVNGKVAGCEDGITGCMRHAGSGTHATFDNVVMENKTLIDENLAGPPWYYFNDGSSDMKYCIESCGNNCNTIGYMDSDQTGTNIKRISYNGYAPTKCNIADGKYVFWASQQLMTTSSDPLVIDFINYGGNPANLNQLPPAQRDNWLAFGQMRYTRSGCGDTPAYAGGTTYPVPCP